MERFFNTSGPNRFDDNYSLNPFKRIDYREIMALIGQKKYFVLSSPSQSGKTTMLLALMYHLNKDGKFRCIHLDMTFAQEAGDDVRKGMALIIRELARQARDWLGDNWPLDNWQRVLAAAEPEEALYAFLWEWLSQNGQDQYPLILLLDDMDALSGDMLVSVLRQLHVGYQKRPRFFPQNIFLSCASDIRERKIRTGAGEVVGGADCLGIKTEFLGLSNFTVPEIQELYEQHTADTKQVFAKEIYPEVRALTGGQPWLVNALGRQLTWDMREYRDRGRAIDMTAVGKAAERLIFQKASHIANLKDVLQDPKVSRIVAPLLAGGEWDTDLNTDELAHVEDLGLIERSSKRTWRIPSKIYHEVVPRVFLAKQFGVLDVLISPEPYIHMDGKLNFRKLIGGFQQFYRERGEGCKKSFPHEKVWSHLLFQAYLQAVLEDKGRTEREYEFGGGRVDLFVSWDVHAMKTPVPSSQRVAEGAANKSGLLISDKNPYAPQAEGFDLFGNVELALRGQRFAVELRAIQGTLDAAINEGLVCLANYAAQQYAEEAHLVLFDHSEGKWGGDRIFVNERQYDGRAITVWGM